ncbi:TetR/AcrR family transcriptional regulator [Streptomyces sp. NPDC051940]|uniref:TetR/AcrR family transcriptional regulator n=1 Tax=Streptomyces sp. NPDC051940 TaxID=3155675 RepID=UPI00343BA566
MTTTEHSGSGDLSRSMALLWDINDRPSRGPRPALTLDRIVGAAIAVADAEGLEAVSMRRLAGDLGVGTMSLYRYVPGKGELLDLMLDRVSAVDPERVGTLDDDWREALRQLARGMWELYVGHPWLLHVDQARPVLGPNGLKGFEIALTGLDGTPLGGREKTNVVTIVEALVSSIARTHVNAAQAEARTGISDAEFWEAQMPALSKAMQSGAYPHIAALEPDAFSTPGDAVVAFAMERLIDGFEVFFAGRDGPPPPGATCD